MRLKAICAVLVIGARLYGFTPTETATNSYLPWIDLTPYRLDGVGFVGQDAVESLLRIRAYPSLKLDVAKLQSACSGLEMALSNQSDQTQVALKLSDDWKKTAGAEKRLGDQKGLIGLGIGSAAGLIVGMVGSIIIYNAVKK